MDIQLLGGLVLALTLARILIFDSMYFVYLLWNVFLAALPFAVSSFLVWRSREGKISKVFFILGGIVWMLLLPNAPYIVTDLIHIGRGHGAPVLFDTFLLFSAAWLGLVLFFRSLDQIKKILYQTYSKNSVRIIVLAVMLLTSVGIYIGRYLRFNSWDVLTDVSVVGNTWQTITHPAHFLEACLFIVPCFVFVYMSYEAWGAMKRGE